MFICDAGVPLLPSPGQRAAPPPPVATYFTHGDRREKLTHFLNSEFRGEITVPGRG